MTVKEIYSKIEGLNISIKHIREEVEFIVNCSEGLESYSDAYYAMVALPDFLIRQRDELIEILRERDEDKTELEKLKI